MRVRLFNNILVLFVLLTVFSTSLLAEEEIKDLKILTLADFNLKGSVKEYAQLRSKPINDEQVEVYGVTVYKFDESGVLQRKEKYKADKTLESYVEYVIDNNRLVEIRAMDVLRGKDSLDTLKQLTYNDEKNIKTIKHYNWDNSLEKTEKFYYNDRDQLTRYGHIEPNKNILIDCKYDYDDQGQLTFKSVKWKVNYTTQYHYKYDSNGFLIEELELDDDYMDNFRNIQKMVHSYNSDNKRSETMIYTYNNRGEDEKQSSKILYSYQPNNITVIENQKFQYSYKTGEEWFETTSKEIITLQDGKEEHLFYDKKGVLLKGYDSTTNEKSLLLSAYEIDKNKKRTTGNSMKYNDQDLLIEKLEYDRSNSLKYKSTYQYDDQNNLIINKKYRCTEVFDEIEEDIKEYHKFGYVYY